MKHNHKYNGYFNKPKEENKKTEEIEKNINNETEEIEKNINNETEKIKSEESINKNGKIKGCTKLYIRKDASLSSEPIGIINVGEIVQIIEETGSEFYKIKVNNIIGYSMRDFIVIE